MENNKGFTIIEMIIAMVIISLILLVVVPLGQAAMDNSRVTNAMASIKAIQTAAVSWANDNGGQYTGITFSALQAGYLPAQFSATATNPWKGDYDINVDSNDTEKLDVKLTNVPSSAGNKLVDGLTKISSDTKLPQYDKTGQTFTIVLQ